MTERRAPTTAKVAGMITTHKANASAHHSKYTDAEAKAAAVKAGAITNGETKAPTHDAVYDVKLIAEAAGGAVIATGSYTGDDSWDRQIATGMKCSYVIVCRSDAGIYIRICYPNITFRLDAQSIQTDCLLHATDGFVVGKLNMNIASQIYYYWAISE